MSNKAYNFRVTPLAAANVSTNSNGKPLINFRAKTTIGGREVERTVVAQGAAADALAGLISEGVEVGVRALISHAPANDGGRGGQFLSVVGLPNAKAAKAA